MRSALRLAAHPVNAPAEELLGLLEALVLRCPWFAVLCRAILRYLPFLPSSAVLRGALRCLPMVCFAAVCLPLCAAPCFANVFLPPCFADVFLPPCFATVCLPPFVCHRVLPPCFATVFGNRVFATVSLPPCFAAVFRHIFFLPRFVTLCLVFFYFTVCPYALPCLAILRTGNRRCSVNVGLLSLRYCARSSVPSLLRPPSLRPSLPPGPRVHTSQGG